MAVTTLEAALAVLSTSVPWFDDAPGASEGPLDLATVFPDGVSEWDILRVLDFQFYCDIGGKIGTKLDVKSSANQNHATLTNHGRKNTPIDVTIYLFTAIDLANFALLLPQVFQMSDARRPVQLLNPALDIFGQAMRDVGYYLFDVGLIKKPRGGEPGSVILNFHQFTTPPQLENINGTPKFKAPVISLGNVAGTLAFAALDGPGVVIRRPLPPQSQLPGPTKP